MSIINKSTEQKENSLEKSKKIAFYGFFVLLTMVLLAVNFFTLAKAVNANDTIPEIPMCSFEEKEGRTLVNFGDKKIVSHLSSEEAESESVTVDLPAGSYGVSLFSYDEYEGREDAFPQPKESWFAVLKNGGDIIAKSSPVDDLEDWVLSATMTQVVDDELVIDEDIDSISALNSGYPDESSPNSVYPVCAAFDLIELKDKPLINNVPVIILLGDNPLELNLGDSFTDPGATASDTEDGDLTGSIIVVGVGDVDTGTEGTYIITYNVSDSQGEGADEVTRAVIVSESSDGGGGGSSSSSESSSSSSGVNGGGDTDGVGGDGDESISVGGGSGRISFGGSSIILPSSSSSSLGITSVTEEESSSSIGQCSYLKDYLKFGENNDPAEVLKLQAFLRVYEKIEVPLTGVFGKETFDAVSVFQERYTEDILTPWGYETSTGYVYITTKNKINEIFCGDNRPLSEDQKNEIEKVRNYINEFGRTGGPDNTGQVDVGGIIGNASEDDGEDSGELVKENESEKDNFMANVGFIKSPMAFILDNKLTVALIGAATALLIYLFSFRGGKI